MENDVFLKALGPCRTCGHHKIAHTLKYKNRKTELCLDARLDSKAVYRRCPCKQFVPKDNLEFLEWAAQNKEEFK